MKPCFMQSMQSEKTFTNNEEYKKYLGKVNRIYLALSIVGFLLLVLGVTVEWAGDNSQLPFTIDDYMLGLYSGAGTGLFVGGIIVIFRNRYLMKNEQKLTAARIEQGDERVQEIGKRATRTATYAMIGSLYAIALIGGLFYPVLPKILLIVILIFLFTYIVSYRILEKKY